MKVLVANPATRESISETKERFFIKAGSRWPWSLEKNKNEKNTACFFPFFLAYTANLLIDAKHEVQVIDGVAMDMAEAEFMQRTTNINPDFIVIETQTHAIGHDLSLCKKIKSNLPNVKILLCGAHVTIYPKELLEENPCIDFVTKAEYEFTVFELVQRLESGNSDLKIDGLAYRNENGDVWVSEKKGFIEDINTLPSPAFGLFPTNNEPDLSIYGDGICTYRPAVTLHASRGCPFKCDFCLWNQVMYDHKYRMFSPDRIVDEMEYVKENYGAKEVYFDDDDFCINKKHVLALCKEIKDRGLNIKWSCMGDAMASDEEMIREMANAGCIFMKFGVESGNEQVLKNIRKPLKPDKAVKVSKWCRKYGIMTHATFSFGLDGDTHETMQDTLNLANRIKFDTAQASISTPFPGTFYHEKLVEKGHLDAPSWDSFDGTTNCTFNTDELTSEEIEKFRRKAIKSMVFHKAIDPVWQWRFMKRNYLLYKNYGLNAVLSPFKALADL